MLVNDKRIHIAGWSTRPSDEITINSRLWEQMKRRKVMNELERRRGVNNGWAKRLQYPLPSPPLIHHGKLNTWCSWRSRFFFFSRLVCVEYRIYPAVLYCVQREEPNQLCFCKTSVWLNGFLLLLPPDIVRHVRQWQEPCEFLDYHEKKIFYGVVIIRICRMSLRANQIFLSRGKNKNVVQFA